jgi:peptidoglycan/xylan/chitin deacetylase (PgdA/CDA1 family)
MIRYGGVCVLVDDMQGRAGEGRPMRDLVVSVLATVGLAVATGNVPAPAPAPEAVAGPAARESPLRASPAKASVVAAEPKTVALTFDDGPSAYTAQVLDVLKRYNVTATFCVLGDEVRRYPGTARRIVREGHRLCNHTRNHPDMVRLSSSAARRQITGTQQRIRAVTGITPTTFRFPYGSSNARVRAIVKRSGLRNLRWDVDTRDWQRPPARTITARILRGTGPGDVVLMHDGGGNRSTTVASLDDSIRGLRKKGYTFAPA